MSGLELYKRVELLRAFDLVVKRMNNEESEDVWLVEGVPDGADLEDLVGIAEDEELWEGCQEAFWRTVGRYGKDGWYCAW